MIGAPSSPPPVSQPLVIKDVTGQFGAAGGGRSDFNRFHAEVCVCHQAGKLSSSHRERRRRPQAGEEGRGGGAQVAGRRGDVENEESRMLRCFSARSTGKPPFPSSQVSSDYG